MYKFLVYLGLDVPVGFAVLLLKCLVWRGGCCLLTRNVFASAASGSTAWEDAPDPPPAAFALMERERDRVVEAVVPDADAEVFRRRRADGDDQ